MKTRLFFIFLSISMFGFAQNGEETVDEIIDFLKVQDDVNYFDVSKEMFQMLSESKDVSPEFRDYVSKISKLRMIEARGETKFCIYDTFIDMTDLSDFSRLMTSVNSRNKLSFYKKTYNTENEFLMVSSEAIIYVVGTIELRSISEFETVMEIAGSAFDM